MSNSCIYFGSTLKKLVPPSKMCLKIPDGEFSNSTFQWISGGFGSDMPWEHVIPREAIGGMPAPTLEEIMHAIRKLDKVVYAKCLFCEDAMDVKGSGGSVYATLSNRKSVEAVFNNQSAAVAALEVWLKLKGIEA